jgi:hypothetical protein
MANTVNLRQARKEKTRAKKRTEGTEAALQFGQPKSERERLLAEMKRAQARFEAHKRDGGSGGDDSGA